MKRKNVTRMLSMMMTTSMLAGTFMIGMSARAEESQEPTQLTFWTYVEQHTEFMQDAVDTWNAAHPDEMIELKTETYPTEDMHSKLLITLQSGDGAPDLVDVNVARFSDFMQGDSKVFVELNDIIEPEKESFLEPVLDIYKYDGNYYGIEYHVGAPMMFYNTEILDQAGVKVEDIVTWDDLHEAGKKVLEATGKPIITFEVNDSWSYYIMAGEKYGDYFDADGNCIIDSETNAEVLDFMLSMIEDGTAVTTPGGGFHTEEYYGYMSQGGCSSMLECMWYMGSLQTICRSFPEKFRWQHRRYGMKTAYIRYLEELLRVLQRSVRIRIWQKDFWQKRKSVKKELQKFGTCWDLIRCVGISGIQIL